MKEQLSFGEWLRKQRRALDLSRHDLAEQAGCAEITLRRIEVGTLKPSKELASLLLEKVGIPQNEIESWIRFARGQSGMPLEQSTSETRPHTNLPALLTSFIGREKEQVEIFKLIEKYRLVTLVGSGGVGKTRLSIKVSEQVLENYADGVWLLELAALRDAALLPQTVVALFGITAQSNISFTDLLINFLLTKSALLILDNCEHLLDACAQLADTLLKSCPHMKILATSREPLGITGEAIYRVPSLGLPDFQQVLDTFRDFESVRLFEERAKLAQFDFALTLENALSVAQICYRLDGIPLAIELAAAKVESFSTEQIAKQLDESFNLLTGGSRTALPRQQTLHASVDWSWNLLTESEQTLMQQLSVFSGGWTLDAALAICDGDVMGLTSSLVGKSLIVMNQEGRRETRYGFHEVIHQYAREKLFELGEGEKVRDRHLNAFIELAEKAEPEIRGANQSIWLDRLDKEIDNLRAALEWSQERDKESFLRLASALWRFWSVRAYISDWEWLPRALAATQDLQNPLRARAAGRASYIAAPFGDKRARTWANEAETLSRALDDKSGLAMALAILGELEMDLTQGLTLLDQALELSTEIGDHWLASASLISRAHLYRDKNDLATASRFFEQGVQAARRSGDKRLIGYALGGLGWMSLAQRDAVQAEKYYREALSIVREIGDYVNTFGYQLSILTTRIFLEDYAAAKEMLPETFRLGQIGKFYMSAAFVTSAWIELAQGNVSGAIQQMEEALLFAKQTTAAYRIANAVLWLGDASRRVRDFVQSGIRYEEALAIIQKENLGNAYYCVYFELMGMLAIDQGQAARGALLFGARETLRASLLVDDFYPFMVRERESRVAKAREQLGEEVFQKARQAGKDMSLEEAIRYVQKDTK